jgi:hypothetical protein
MSASPAGVAAMTEREKLALTIAFGIAIGYLASLLLIYSAHIWILDAAGHPVVDDFAAFWSAGRLALKGAALATYDPHLQHAAEVATIGHDYSGSLGWSYPPAFLFIASALARLPYAAAFLAWCASTLIAYAVAIGAISRLRGGVLFACAAPWVLTALTPGQNGFLTAALFGACLLQLETRPALAGLFLGLLSYKPQFGVLFPLALAAGGYWRAFAWAAAAALASNVLAGAVFGFGTFAAFFHSLGVATQSHLAVTGLGWNKLQSIYGLARSINLSGRAAWTAQALVSLALALGVVFCWRARVPFALKAACLATAALLATPYVFVYDLPVLSVAVAFLAQQRHFSKIEIALLASTVPCVFGFLWLPIPTALFASVAVGAMVAGRIEIALRTNPLGMMQMNGNETGPARRPQTQTAS